MTTRRQLIQMTAAIPVIGRIDYAEWSENTDAGLPPGLDQPFGISDLVEMPSSGPYHKFVWLDFEEGSPLPVVRATAWVSDHELAGYGYEPDTLHVGVNFGDGYQRYDVTHLIDPEYTGPLGSFPLPVEREALMRVIRVIIREHYGYPTAHTP